MEKCGLHHWLTSGRLQSLCKIGQTVVCDTQTENPFIIPWLQGFSVVYKEGADLSEMNGSESLRQSPSKHNLCLLKRDVFHFWCVSHIFKFQVTTAWWIVGKCLQASWCLPYNHSYLLMLMTKPIFIQQKPATCSNHLPTSARKQWLQRPVWLRLALVQK